MSDSLLKKEFKQRDVQRVRNLVNKDYTAKTRSGIGYEKEVKRHKEGDIWEEVGKQWTIINGIKQNVTKLDAAKKAVRVPLRCPQCNGSMEHHLHKRMYTLHKVCFDCTIKYEDTLKKAGLYEAYAKRMLQGNMIAFAADIEAWVLESLNETDTFVTEQGDIEDWKNNNTKFKKEVLDKLQEYLKNLKSNIDS
jgi:hypothetical protein